MSKMRLWVFCFFCCLGTHLLAKEPIPLIWIGCDPKALWEQDWIHEVLSNLKDGVQEIVDLKYEVFVNNSLVVTSYYEGNKDLLRNYFLRCKEKGLKYGVIQLSDEHYDQPQDLYPTAQFVIRNYWHKGFSDQSSMFFFPLGYKTKFWNGFQGSLKEASSRKYTWSFAGQYKKSTRMQMINCMYKVPNYYIHEISRFNDSNSLSAQEYRDLLLDTVFVPCPRGFWNLDSFRVYEALECGCIPIVEKTPLDYFGKFFGDYPFLAVESWKEAPGIIKGLLAHPDQLEELRQRCHIWWLKYKKNLKKEVADLIELALE